MTLDQFYARLAKLSSDDIVGNALYLGVQSSKALMSERIFQKGEAVDGKIGTYNSSNPLYISDSRLPKNGTHLGKPNAKGESKKNKTTYYESYKAMRDAQGRDSENVNLRLQNRLQGDFNNAPVLVSPTEVTINVSELSRKKIEGNEARFGKKIFALNPLEKETLTKVIMFEIKNALFA